MTETAMCWGFSCDDGWFDLIDTLCKLLQFWTDRNEAPQVVAAQVKQKFGGLRFYVKHANEMQRGMITMAETMSFRTCEVCGMPGVLSTVDNWSQTRCSDHTPR
jgi:hypothetical protein